MGDLSDHFSRSEFRCKCQNCGRDTVDTELLMLCEIVRHVEGGPVAVTSGHRCRAHNKRVGGAQPMGANPGSQHLYGRAADLIVSSPAEVYAYLCRRFPDKYGFGLYDRWVHVDSRSGPPARWEQK